jgi:hypothetical protein
VGALQHHRRARGAGRLAAIDLDHAHAVTAWREPALNSA